MIPGLSSLSASVGQGSAFGNAGPASTGDTILGPISQGGPVVTFAGASNNGTSSGAGGVPPWALAVAVGAAAWFLSKSR